MEFYLLLSIRGSQIPAVYQHCLGGVTTHNIDPYHQKKGHVDWHHVLWFENITGRPKADDSMTSMLLFFHNSGRESNLFEVIDPILQSLVSSKIYVVVQQYIQAINIFTVEAIRKHALSQILSKHKIKASNDYPNTYQVTGIPLFQICVSCQSLRITSTVSMHFCFAFVLICR